MNENLFPSKPPDTRALKAITLIYKILGSLLFIAFTCLGIYLAAIIAPILESANLIPPQHVEPAFIILLACGPITGLLVFISLIAIAEFLSLYIRIEENTRLTKDLLFYLARQTAGK